MKLQKLLSTSVLVLTAAGALLSGCQGIGSGDTIERLKILPADGRAENPLHVYPCVRDGVILEGIFHSGSVANFTGRADWSSSRPDLLEVTNSREPIPETPSIHFGKGVLRAKQNSSGGQVIITAKFAGLSATIPVIVEPAPTFKISALVPGMTVAQLFNSPVQPQVAVGSKQSIELLTMLGDKPRSVGGAIEWLINGKLDTDVTNHVSEVATLNEFTGQIAGLRADEGGAADSVTHAIPVATVQFGDAIDPDGTGPETPFSSECAAVSVNPMQIRVGNVSSVALAAEADFSPDNRQAVKSAQLMSLIGTLDFEDGNSGTQDLSGQSHFEELCTRRTCNNGSCSDQQDVSCVATDKVCPALTTADTNGDQFCRLDVHFLVAAPNVVVALNSAFTPTMLAADIANATDTTIAVQPFNLNQAPDFKAVIDSETMLVTAIDTTTSPGTTLLTVTRGYAGSTAATHTTGTVVMPAASDFSARYPSLKGDDTALTNGVDASTTAITIDSLQHYPLPPWEAVIVDSTNGDERVLITSIEAATTNLTVVRGYDGTTAVQHAAGTPFQMFVATAPTPVSVTPSNGTMTALTVCPLTASSDPSCPSYASNTINHFDTLQLQAVGTWDDTVNPTREQRATHLGVFSTIETPKVSWTSSDTSIGVVSATGLVTSISECGGTVTFRARANSSTNTDDKVNTPNDPADPTTATDDTACTSDPLCDEVPLDICPAATIPSGVTCTQSKPASCP